ncbi:MAG: DUF4232 domain-containing protein [Actinomycetota bacterium]
MQPPCGASQLRAAPEADVGAAAGNILYRVMFSNVGRSACLLGPRPAVQALDARGRFVALPLQEGGTYFDDPAPADTAPGESGFLNIGTSYSGNCPETPEVTFRLLRFGFPDGWLNTDLTIVEGCGTLQISGIGKQPLPAPQPTAAPGDPGAIHASLGHLPTIRPGITMRYTVTLSNPTETAVSLTPCPSFTQSLDRHRESLYLNCDEVKRIDPGQEVEYAMEREVPTELSSTEVKFSWRLNTPTGPFVGGGLKVGD